MAKTIVDEKLRYSIEINGNEAQKELLDIEKTQRKLTERAKELTAEKRKLKEQNKQNTAEWKRVTAEMRDNNLAMKANDRRMAELRGEIGITSLTIRQLGAESKRLRQLLINMTPGSADFIRYNQQLAKVDARMKELRLSSRATRSSIGRLADGFNRYAALGASFIATLTGMVISIQKLLDFSGKLSDAQADVAKTTGLSSKAVDDLTRRLGLFKTRSARIELLQLAEEAGRLGKNSVKDILEFVKTGDKIKVALGDDLQGDVNENIRIIGKLTEQYKVGAHFGASFGEGMEMIGSAINEVSASGSAQAGFLVDFMSRLVGVSQQANIAAQDILGIGAVLDESGQRVETSATALNQVIINMAKDPGVYANIAGLEVKEFARLVKEDANEALLIFLKGLNGNNEGLAELSQKFDGLGIDGTRAITVLASLAGQTGKIREKQDFANKSLNEGTSLTEEARKKNENFAAALDKLRKRIVKLILEGGLVGWIQDSVTWFAKFVGAIDDTDGSVTRFREGLVFFIKIATVAATALLSYQAALKLADLWTRRNVTGTTLHTLAMKGKAAADYIALTAQGLYIISTNLLTGTITLATAAQRTWNLVFAANPIGAVIAVVSAAATAYFLFREATDNLTAAQRNLNEAHLEAKKTIAEERASLDGLLAIAREQGLALEERRKAIEMINKISPEYLGNINLENVSYLETTKAVEEYIKALEKKAFTIALQERRVELYKELLDKESSSIEDNVTWYQELTNSLLAGGDATRLMILNLKSGAENRAKDVVAINEQIKALTELEVAQKRTNDSSFRFSDYDKDGRIKNDPGIILTEEQKAAQEAALKFLKKLREGDLTDVEKKYAEALELLKTFYSDEEELTKAQLQVKREILSNYYKEKRIEDLERTQEETEAEQKRQQDLLQSSMDQLFLFEQGRLWEDHQNKLLTKDEFNEELQQLEIDHLKRLIAARKLAGEETLQLEMQLAEAEEKQLEDIQKRKDEKRKLTQDQEELLLLQQRADGLLTKEQYDLQVLQLELRHLQAMIDAKRKAGEETVKLEKEYLDKQLEYNDQLAESQRDLRREQAASAAASALNNAAMANSAEEAKDVIIKAIRDIIAAQIAKAVAEFVASEISEKQWVGLITGAVASAATIALFNAVVPSFDSGKNMHIVRDQHGDTYKAVRNEKLETGLYHQPTVSYSKNMLIAEKRPEIVIDGLTTNRLMNFHPEVFETIRYASRSVRGYADGNFGPMEAAAQANGASSQGLERQLAINNEIMATLAGILKNGVYSNIGDRDIRKMRQLMDRDEQIEKSA